MPRSALFISPVIVVLMACGHKQIQLDPVRYVPEYFHNSNLFGEDEKAMEEKNTFLLETGYIDTTSETPPIQVAYIAIDQQTIQLNGFKRMVINGDEVEQYTGAGYTVLLYRSGKVQISKEGRKSEYNLLAATGYK